MNRPKPVNGSGQVNASSTETAMKFIFGFLAALVLNKLFDSFNIVIDLFFQYGIQWEIFFFLFLVSLWIFRYIYGTALSLLESKEIITIPLSGKLDNLKVLSWRFCEFLSFIFVFHIVEIVGNLAVQYEKDKGILSNTFLLSILKEFTWDILLICGLWTLWRIIFNHLILKILDNKDSNSTIKRTESVFYTFLLFLSVILPYTIPIVIPKLIFILLLVLVLMPIHIFILVLILVLALQIPWVMLLLLYAVSFIYIILEFQES